MNLYETLKKHLQGYPEFTENDGEMKKWVVIQKTKKNDPKIIKALLDNPQLKSNFFTNVEDSLIFERDKFIYFLEYKNYINDSYTKHKNIIGLTIDGKYLNKRNEVELVWPYKDCILEGGQSKEEVKREEIFFNETLAQDEITQLLEPKVLTSVKVFNKNGESQFKGFNRDANINKQRNLPEDTITDNLIIKGNNLLALHSIKKQFAGKVKLIYIDPPYNTRNDSFKYNDSFNHASWLTFMRNRLEVARTLLRDDGIIFVQCDDNEHAYLKVLMDEVFGRDNFVSNIIWKGRGGRQDTKHIAQIHETIICYSKIIIELELNKKKTKDISKYPYFDEKENKYYKIQLVRKWGGGSRKEDRPNLFYKVKFEGNEIYPILPDGSDGRWRWSKNKLNIAIENNLIISQTKNNKTELYEKIYRESDIKEMVNSSVLDETFSGNSARHHLNIFKKKVFEYPKPEGLLKILVEMNTQKNDIILDYHLGSGTTAAAAHKMERQYIGIEQMDYIKHITLVRLREVIEGEQGEISKNVNWKGGGSFTYVELKKYNQTFIEKIEAARKIGQPLKIWQEMKSKSFINYNVDIKKQDADIELFKSFEIEEQKEILHEILDKNQLYVNLSSLEDKDFKCTKDEKKVTKSFYDINDD